MEVFYNLLKKCVPANIPVYLIKDKIYSSKTFSEIVKSNLDQILKLTLSEKKMKLVLQIAHHITLNRKVF